MGVDVLLMKTKYLNYSNKNKNVYCKCQDSFYGYLCEHKLHCGNCINTKCDSYSQCKSCPKGYKGKACTELTVENFEMCKNNGN